jgi:hypothetical protein
MQRRIFRLAARAGKVGLRQSNHQTIQAVCVDESDLGETSDARIKKTGEQPETRREPTRAQKVMLGEPSRVIAGALHYFDSLQRALIDRLDRDALARAN